MLDDGAKIFPDFTQTLVGSLLKIFLQCIYLTDKSSACCYDILSQGKFLLSRLPDARHKTVPCLQRVVRISREFLHQHLVLVHRADDQKYQPDSGRDERPK